MIIFLNGDGTELISPYRDVFSSFPADIIIYAPRIKITDFERILTEIVLGEELRVPMTLKDLYKLIVFKEGVKASKYTLKYDDSSNSLYIEEESSNFLARLFRKKKAIFLPSTTLFYSKNKIIVYRKDKLLVVFSLDSIKKSEKAMEKISELIENTLSSKIYVYTDKFESFIANLPAIIEYINRSGKEDCRVYIKNGEVKVI